ncbi:MAG: hypothetical protein JWM80_4450 [Cyanobacteria bacterium RYN_339]|nr:hypothetical protein [Cyanobacteria bacterium RYN_339]
MFGPLRVKQPRAEMVVPRKYGNLLADPQAFVAELGRMHEAMEDLTGVPCGGRDRLILAFEHGNHGALWAYADGSPGHHVGVPPATWPRLVAAANRRPMVSALVHELGHVAFWWDWEPRVGSHYLMWGGAVEGTATPTGAYACVKYQRVPAWIDFPAGDRDWASLQDFVNDILRGGVEARKRGAAGQDSVGHQGHGDAASMVEATLWDLFFRVLGSYDAYRQVLHHYVAALRTPAQAQLDDHAKMSGFFALLGQAAGLDLADYLTAWGYDATDVRAACRHLPACDARLPDPPPPVYGKVTEPGWA